MSQTPTTETVLRASLADAVAMLDDIAAGKSWPFTEYFTRVEAMRQAKAAPTAPGAPRTLTDLRADVCTLRNKVEELQEEARQLWVREMDEDVESELDDFKNAMEDIAASLGEQENDG